MTATYLAVQSKFEEKRFSWANICYSCLDLGDPNQAVFFGAMGVTSALVFANLGAAYGTAKSGVGIVSVAVLKPDLLFRSIIPVVMAGILGMYGMIIAILLKGNSKCYFVQSAT